MTQAGYYRQPTICKDQVVFICDDDLWSVNASGGTARRLTKGIGECSYPKLSPDGKYVAFIFLEEGHPEVYVMPSEGGEPKRLTYLGSEQAIVIGWTSDSKKIIFCSDARTPFFRHAEGYELSPETGEITPLQLGHLKHISRDEKGRIVLGRNATDPSMWKRYRGGTAGQLWIDADGKGEFKRLCKLNGNLVNPMWVKDRVYFLSDHEGVGNIYSCLTDGTDVKRHTQHSEYYVRFPSCDGERIIYGAGANIYLLDCKTNAVNVIDIDAPAQEQQLSRKFSNPIRHLEHIAVHPKGHKIGFITRGQAFTMPFFEGACVQHSPGSEVRYRFLQWLNDGEKLIAVSDIDKYERIVLHDSSDPLSKPVFLTDSDIGRIISLEVSPDGTRIAFSNHRHELMLLDLKSKKVSKLDHSSADRISSMSWAPDSRWLAYGFFTQSNLSIIKIADADSGKCREVTRAVRMDYEPVFDPEGKYLYFLSNREFKPIYDSTHFGLSFPRATRPYVITLTKSIRSPFAANEKAFLKGSDSEAGEAEQKKDEKKEKVKKVEIDFDGIQDRILACPVEEGLYSGLLATKDRILFLAHELKGIGRDHSWLDNESAGDLCAYDFEEQKQGALLNGVKHMVLAQDGKTLVAFVKENFQVLDASQSLDKPAEASEKPGRKTGVFDLSRCNLLVEPRKEWTQMYREAWRLQSEHFWDEKMSDIDWNLVFERYALVLPKVRTRAELSDLLWEMQGELGTSHAYEFGGDRPSPRPYHKGFLGCDLNYDEKNNGFRISNILRGDCWDRDCDSPLAEPGLQVEEGDLILQVNGRNVGKNLSADELLIKAGDKHVQLTIKSGKSVKTVTVKTLRSERYLRYRHWVETNRQKVHEASNGKLGYIHIPDMGPHGYAEFHRSYLAEFNHEGLVIDVRYNRGGHVSSLLLEKLMRKRLGYDVSRYGEPQPYPSESPVGPMVAITNQFAGSDGDIFSHCFKMYKLGPLVGERTWGGVIGIYPRHALVDGTITTQPEFSFWFSDVGWSVENYGTDPDHPVDYKPQDYKKGHDPQIEKAVELALDSLKTNPFKLPDFKSRPKLSLPAKLK